MPLATASLTPQAQTAQCHTPVDTAAVPSAPPWPTATTQHQPLSTFQRLLQDAQYDHAQSFTVLRRPESPTSGRPTPRAPQPSHSFCPAQHDAMLQFARANQVIVSEEFLAAWLSDHTQLTPFEQTSGEVGIEECFAETGARIHGGCPTVRRERPALSAYFDRLDASQIDLT